MTDTAAPTTVNVTIDGQAFEAGAGELIIEAADRAGVYIPRFCYHPRMEPVGMCRMCLVEVSGPRGFSLQPACYLRVADGQEVRTSSEKARKAQEGVLEFLLVNHPLDCPVCDKGGECPLQDQALSHGPGESRFIEEKRHWEKPIEIGPLVYLDRERCIQCARCTRFADEMAGEALIDFAFRGDAVEVAPFPTRPFSSYFSGNTVQICPVGALTATPYRFAARPWDLEQVETTCTTCAVGCRVAAQSSAGELVRFLGIDSEPVNQSWLCDKGRFGYEAVHAESRLEQPQLRRDGKLEPSTWNEALAQAATALRAAASPEEIAVIGGSRLTNEDAFVWAKFAKSVLRTDSVDAQVGDGIPATTLLGLPRATIEDAVAASVVILLAPDLREELPVLFLRIRQAVISGATRIIECSAVPSALSEHAAARLTVEPGEASRLVAALTTTASDVPGVSDEAIAEARAVLKGEGNVVVVLGRQSASESAYDVAEAAALLHERLPNARFLSALRRANVHGALEMGLAPELLPGRVALEDGRGYFEAVWGAVPTNAGRDTEAILRAAAAGEVRTLVLLAADPLADFPDRRLAAEALGNVENLIALGSHRDDSNGAASVVLPIAGEHERGGTTTNLEARVTRLAPKVPPPGVAWPAWMVAAELSRRLGTDLGAENQESITEEIARVVPTHRGVGVELLGRTSMRDGVVVPLPAVPVTLGRSRGIDPMATPGILSVTEQGAPLLVGAAVPLGGEPEQIDDVSRMSPPPALRAPMPRGGEGSPRRDAYSLRLVVRRSLYDAGTLVSASPALAPLAASQVLSVHPAELARLGVESGGRLRVRAGGSALEVEAVAEAKIARGVVALITRAGTGGDAGELIDAGAAVTDVRLETI